MSNKPVILIGCGGHAKVVACALLDSGREVIGVVDNQFDGVKPWRWGIDLIGDDSAVLGFADDEVELALGIGQMPGNNLRQRIFDDFKDKGYRFATVVSPRAMISRDVVLAEGVQVLDGAIIQCCCVIGANTIVNTGAQLDHDCEIGSNCHLAPGTTLSGGVKVGNGTMIGVGATVIQGISIGQGAILGAGATCYRDVNDAELLLAAKNTTKQIDQAKR